VKRRCLHSGGASSAAAIMAARAAVARARSLHGLCKPPLLLIVCLTVDCLPQLDCKAERRLLRWLHHPAAVVAGNVKQRGHQATATQAQLLQLA
jgi:hypothetical protein